MTSLEFDRLEFEQVAFLAKMIGGRKAEAIRSDMRVAAYSAFLAGAAGKDRSYGQYLRMLGLADKEPKMSKAAKKVVSQRAHSIAQRIISMDKRKK